MNNPQSAIRKPQSADAILGALESAEAQAAAVHKVDSAADLIPHVKITDPEGNQLLSMERWPLAVELLNEFWPKHKRSLTIKPRQVGVSWDFALYCLHHAAAGHRTIGSVNYNKDAAGELLHRMETLWLTMPTSLRSPLKAGTRWNTSAVEFANGTRIIALPTTDVAGAGLTFSLVGIDEAGLIKNLGDNWPAILPAVEFGQLHLFSTPRDAAGKFFELVTAARGGSTTFALREIQWNERPGRDEAWKTAQIADLGSLRNFGREYGLQFTRPGSAYFDDDLITRIKARCIPPLETLWRNGRLKIWRRPDPKRRYLIGGDVAEGLDDGDYSTAGVLDYLSGEEVAAYHAHVGLVEYPEDLVKLARMYNAAWIAVEANNHGHAVAGWMYNHCRYRRVFREWRRDEGSLTAPAARLGLTTGVSSKPAMLGGLEHALRNDLLKVLDAAAAEELSTFLCLPGGEYGAAAGQHDDRVIRLALEVAARRMPIARMA